MRTVQAIPVNKVSVPQSEPANKTISGETIVKESGGSNAEASPSMFDDSFVDIDLDNDVISNEDMQRWMSQL